MPYAAQISDDVDGLSHPCSDDETVLGHVKSDSYIEGLMCTLQGTKGQTAWLIYTNHAAALSGAKMLLAAAGPGKFHFIVETNYLIQVSSDEAQSIVQAAFGKGTVLQ